MSKSVSFPLYDELAKEALQDPKEINLKNLAATLSALSLEHASNVFLLVYHHSATQNKFSSIPYSGNFLPGGKGVIFPIQSVPPALLQIIIKYIERAS